MGTMNKLRENTGVILWILVISFGLIWVLQDSGAFDAIGYTTGQNVAVVDGTPVTYEEYASAVDAQVQRYQEQTGETMPPQVLDQERERVYQALIENKLLEREMDRLGITVTDEEIYDMVMGEDPHPIITVYFGDGQGGVNRALLENFASNPEARADWIQIEEYLRNERRREKMENLISASVRVTDQDVLNEYRKRNYRVDAQWVGLRFASLPDDSVQVSERELEAFYDEHREEFKRNRTYTLNYVTVTKHPAPEDSARVMDELTRMRPRFEQAEDDSAFVTQNASERPYASTWFSASDLDPAVATEVFKTDPQPGTIIGPFFAGNEAHLVKIQDVQPSDELSVRASHILFRGEEEAQQQAQQVKERIESGGLTFAEAARQYGTDGTAANGGDLGWFGPGDMVLPFQEAAFDAPVNQTIGPIKTDFGWHLIKVTARADEQVRIADYAQRVRTDVGTLNERQEQLEDLRYFAEESDDFQAEAERLGLDVQQVQVEADQEFIPGLGNSRALQNFLAGADEGDLSPVIELNEDFVVAQVTEIAPEGYRSFDEVRAELEPRVRNEKKAEILKTRMQRALEQHGFDGLAAALGEEVRTATDVTFNTSVVPLLGREPKFTGTVLGLDEGEVSGVVEGDNAVFVARVTNVEEPAEITEQTRAQIRNQLLQQRRNQLLSQWLSTLREQADIEDNRPRFQL